MLRIAFEAEVHISCTVTLHTKWENNLLILYITTLLSTQTLVKWTTTHLVPIWLQSLCLCREQWSVLWNLFSPCQKQNDRHRVECNIVMKCQTCTDQYKYLMCHFVPVNLLLSKLVCHLPIYWVTIKLLPEGPNVLLLGFAEAISYCTC